MEVNLLAFGIAKDIIGGEKIKLYIKDENPSVLTLKKTLVEKYPAFEALASFAIAVNENYATDELSIAPSDEIVIIPPVSGG
ncbi:MAG: MoaD/ThiS family protein [Bacteroidota bacterium]